MSPIRKPQKNPTSEAQMEQLGRDLENIELMNEWGKKDSEEARRSTEQKRSRNRPTRMQ